MTVKWLTVKWLTVKWLTVKWLPGENAQRQGPMHREWFSLSMLGAKLSCAYLIQDLICGRRRCKRATRVPLECLCIGDSSRLSEEIVPQTVGIIDI